MIDTTIEIRAVDRQWLIFALQALLAKLDDDVLNKPRGGISAHNYDVFYNIEKVKELA